MRANDSNSPENEFVSIEPITAELETLQEIGLSSAEALSFLLCRAEYEKTLLLIKQYDESATGFFGMPRNGGIEKVVGNIYQTFSGKQLYPTLEEKAVHLFYFLIKDHLFVDGNKRIAAFLFVWILDVDIKGILSIAPSEAAFSYYTIYSLAIFIAESNSKDKKVIINMIISLIQFHRVPPIGG